MFKGREKELNALEKRYNAEDFQCIIVYGRRRVGKTALINQFCKDKKSIFFSALDATEKENLELLSKAIYQSDINKDSPSGTGFVFSNYDTAFEYITELSVKERLVLVIDEFPYLAKSVPSISSRLQHLIDHKWQHGNMYVILCGSSMSFMENQVLGYESPLYGRRTGQLKVDPLPFRDLKEFFPGANPEDITLAYGVTGGIPHYLNKLLEGNGDISEKIINNYLDPASYLYEEASSFLKQELREPAVYNHILRSITEGASRLNEIADKVGIATGTCSKYLSTLIDLRIVKKETPFGEKPGKHTIYKVEDPFFRFWFRFIPGNTGALVTGKGKLVYEYAIKNNISNYLGSIFEDMCRQYLFENMDKMPFIPENIGRWWGSDPVTHTVREIDLMAKNSMDSKEFMAISCKYRNRLTGIDDFKELSEASEAFTFGKNVKMNYGIFSRSGFTEELKKYCNESGIMMVTLEDMFL